MLKGLEGLLGGSGGERVQDFINRYNQGHPSEGIEPEETAGHYSQITPQISGADYRDSAQAAFERLSPTERDEFAQWMRERAAQHGAMIPSQLDAGAGRSPSASSMADGISQLNQEQPNLLQQIFGQGGALSNPIARAAVAGITAMAAQRLMSRR